MKVLITSGATRARIDGVRFITNFSSGKTGAAIADYFSDNGEKVFFLHGINSQKPEKHEQCKSYDSFSDLNEKIKHILTENHIDIIIQLAAVGDFHVDKVVIDKKEYSPDMLSKIDSNSEISINLKKNFKIISRLRNYSKNKDVKIIGFKLTNTTNDIERKNAIKKVFDCNADYVVHNDMHDINNLENRQFFIFKNNEIIHKCSSRNDLSQKLFETIKGNMQ